LQIDPWPATQAVVPQAAHTAEPLELVKVPALQPMHDDEAATEAVPAGHSEHDDDAPTEYNPAPHM